MRVARRGSKKFHAAFDLGAMAIVVDMILISGRRVSLEACLTDSVYSLAERARRELGAGRERLFASSGSVLDGDA